MSESVYDRAAATWVARKLGLDAAQVTDVDFAWSGGGCDTCDFGAGATLQFSYRGLTNSEVLDITPGQFIQECVGLVEKNHDGSGS